MQQEQRDHIWFLCGPRSRDVGCCFRYVCVPYWAHWNEHCKLHKHHRDWPGKKCGIAFAVYRMEKSPQIMGSFNFVPYSIHRKTDALILPFNFNKVFCFTCSVSLVCIVSSSMSQKLCHFLQLCSGYDVHRHT